MGADITYTCVAPNIYDVKLTFFRDCSGIVPNATEVLQYSSVVCGVTASITLEQPVGSTIDVTPICPSAVSKCDDPGSGIFGFQQYSYTGRLTLPSGCGDDWVLGWSNCCRNFAITTLNIPGNQDMYVSATLDNTLASCNNSPVFNNIPTPIVCVNQPVVYNHGVTDPDGDSLVFSLGACAQGIALPVSYNIGFNATTPLLTSTGVSIDTQTGQLSFTPNVQQIGVICVLVEEYRGGVKIGQTVRDMQFSVVNCNNQAPVATGVNGNNTVFDLDICIGSTTCFDIQISDPDLNNVLTTWNAGIAGGTFTVANDGTTNPVATFCWAPTTADLGTHFFTVTVKDDNCFLTGEATYAFTINVVGVTNSLNASVDASICVGDSANLSSSGVGASNFTWVPATGLSNPNIANPRVSPFVTTVYTVQAQYPDGCLGEAQVTVEVNDPPSVSLTPPVSFLCPGNAAMLTANSPTATTINWSNGGNGTSISVSPTLTTTYEAYVEDVNGCRDTATATVNVNTPGSNLCNVVYVSPGASGTGTAADPGDLLSMLNQVTCNDVVVKMDIGTYTLDNTITNAISNVTLEGGFDRANGWRKTSLTGATTINRTTANPDGLPNAPRISVFEFSNASNFKLQDLTLTTADANLPGMSLYGIHLASCAEYEIVRCQVIVGNAGNGTDGVDGDNGLNAINGMAGTAGTRNAGRVAGLGGDGGRGAGAIGTFGVGGAGGIDQNGTLNNGTGCCLPGDPGDNGGAGSDPRSGDGGGGGAAGGEDANEGGNGGNGGGTIAGGTGGPWNGNNNGGQSNGGNGMDGADGADGVDGADGIAGAHTTGFFVLGANGQDGTDGAGGEGGGGGGGGGGQDALFPGAGSGGGGGGGGGQGGEKGTGGTNGGSAYGIYVFNNGFNGNVRNSFVQVGTAGTAGIGGDGGTGGNKGFGGLGDNTHDSWNEVGNGGDGGDGGDGGKGGDGGDGQPGEAQAFYFNGGQPMTSQETNFGLAAQPVIQMDNISCINTNVDFDAPSSAIWNLGNGATPTNPTGATVSTSYTNVGRKDIIFNSEVYSGFANISQDDAVLPDANATANQINGVYRICEGESLDFAAINGANGYIYHWDLDNGATPNTYDGPGFQTLSNITFATADTFYIEVRYETDCCGLSDPDTVTLIVDPQPTLSLVGPAAVCAGTGGISLSASGSTIYTWAPAASLNTSSGNTVLANPTSTTKYYVTGINASQTCSVRDSITLSVNDLLLAGSSTAEGCLPDGTADITVTGGSGSYDYLWNSLPVQTTQTASGLTTGSYEVVVTDQVTGCKDSVDVFVDKTPGNITAFANVISPVSCNGLADGTAGVVPSGGSGTYTYTWSPGGGNAATSTPLAAGNYTVQVVDVISGCETTVPVAIPEAPPIAIGVLTATDNDCLTFGSVNVNAGGGNGPFSYAWNTVPAQTGPVLDSVPQGTYMVTVTDQDGCVNTAPITMAGPQSPVTLSLVSSQDASSCLINDGEISVLAAGDGTINYNWLITPPQTGATASNLAPGPYQVEAVSSSGCRDTLAITLGPNCPLASEILAFEALADNDKTHLSWKIDQTDKELRYMVSKSVNGIDFNILSTTAAHPALGTFTYTEFDEDIAKGMTYYYQLIMENISGEQAFSSIREVRFGEEKDFEINSLSPNPNQGEFLVEMSLVRNAPLDIKLFDLRGAEVLSWKIDGKRGTQSYSLAMHSQASGVYFLQISSGSGWIEKLKVIKK